MWNAFLALTSLDLRLMARNKAVLVFAYFFPLVFFAIFLGLYKVGDPVKGAPPGHVIAMILVMGMLGNGLYGAGMRLVQDREGGVLRRYKVAPITPHPLLLASVVTGWVVFLPLAGLLAAIAHWKYGMPWPPRIWTLLPLLLAGLAAFRALGLIIAAITNNTQESNALIQLVYMPCLMLSGATIPLSILPGWCRAIAGLLPATYLVNGLDAEFGAPLPAGAYLAILGALLLTAVGCISVAAGLFRWDPEQKISPRARLWLVAGLAPFLLLGLARHLATGLFPSP